MKLIELNEKIDKLKKVIKLIKSKTLSNEEIDDVLVFTMQIIDDFLIKDSSIVFRLNKNLIKNNRILDIEIEPNDEILPTMQTHEILYLTKTLLSILLSKKLFFNIYIFSEISMILNYYVNASVKNKSYDSLNARYKTNEIEYHNQVLMFKYLFSIFDKMLYISAFIVEKYKLKEIKTDKNLIFLKDFDSVAQPLFKSLVKKENTRFFLKTLDQSSAFHFVRKLRNDLEHSFTDPAFEYNIALETEMLFILIVRTLMQISNDFKSDDVLLKTIKLNQ